MHVGVAQTVVGEAVDDRRLDQAAEGRQLPVANVVEHEEQDVRRALGGRGDSGQAGDDSAVVRPMTPVNGVPSL